MMDPYAVLGVPKDADADAIKKAYKKLAKTYHPDLNKEPDAADRFKEVNAAFDILKDPEKRRRYDMFGHADGPPPGPGPGPGGAGFDGFSGFSSDGPVDFEDLLSSMFGAGATARPGRRGPDHKASLRLDPMLAFNGGETAVTITRPGGVKDVMRVRVPAGVTHGGTLRLRGRGGPGRGDAPPGDLVLDLEIPEHPLLRRTGDTLEMDLPITLGEAARGASIAVPTPSGEITVRVPPGAADGQKLRVRGKGVQRAGRPGDLLLVLRLRLPEHLDDEALAAIDVIEQRYGGSPRRGLTL
jgi:curved DNA-binding protein